MPNRSRRGECLPKVIIANATKFRNLGIALIFFSILCAVVGITIACLALMQTVTEPLGYIGLGASAISAIIANVALSFILCLLESPEESGYRILPTRASSSSNESELMSDFPDAQLLPTPSNEPRMEQSSVDPASVISRVVDLLAVRRQGQNGTSPVSIAAGSGDPQGSQSGSSFETIPEPGPEELAVAEYGAKFGLLKPDDPSVSRS